MQVIPIEHIPQDLRELIAQKAKETCDAIESLKTQYAEAVRARDNETANRVCIELAKLCSPQNPAIRIVGGAGGYVEFDEKQIKICAL